MEFLHIKKKVEKNLYLFVCLLFFIAFSTLAILKFNHFGALGYDLGINDQTVWKYSQFTSPIATLGPFHTLPKYVTHLESIYIIIAPFYWIWSDARVLLLLQVAFIASGGIAVYLLAKKRLNTSVSLAILIGYFMFYGVQNALWSDVHSATFATGLLAWFIYLLDIKKIWLTVIVFFLLITAKENMGIIALAVSGVYFFKRREKYLLLFSLMSALFLLFVYYIYFPHIVNINYLYDNKEGLLSGISLANFYNAPEKINVYIYSLTSFGFIPLLYPLTLIPPFADLATYFILASDLKASHGIFMHYRVTLAPLLAWGTVLTIAKYPRLNSKYVAVYILICTLIVQYLLHLPLSYLSKEWFWKKPSSVENINEILSYLPNDTSVAAQNNISPHISHRKYIYTLWPDTKKFEENSPCGKSTCKWIKWSGSPEYVVVDTSQDWDIRHFLAKREDYINGIKNAEKAGLITKYKSAGEAALYKVNKK